jgi:hypothetical protein
MKWEGKEFAEGVWFGIEQLVLFCNNADYAEQIIKESGIEEWEYRQILKESDYHTDELTAFLDCVFEVDEEGIEYKWKIENTKKKAGK